MRRLRTALLLIGVLLIGLPASADEPAELELLKSDSRAPYVHRITLYDHAGRAIDPEKNAVPYSPQMTCAKCHPYAQIAHGWHFNAWDPNVPPGRPGEPWLLVDERTGTVLPLSSRGWPGTFKPQDVGLTNWDMVLQFGRHMPGGGYGEQGGPTGTAIRTPDASPGSARPDATDQPSGATGTRPDIDLSEFDPAAIEKKSERAAAGPAGEGRWALTGKLEVDCMFCHSADQQHDPAEAARQIEAQNFRWAPTAALNLAVIRGEVRKLPDDFDPDSPPNPDYPDRVMPKVVWDQTRFDADDRVLFNITRRPPAERCYFCHTTRQVGPDAPDDLLASEDVHIAAGLVCSDCHRNELDHMTVRGFDGESELRHEAALAAYTCEGCHLGTGHEYLDEEEREELAAERVAAGEVADPALVLGGRYRAPRPAHAGFPPIHFEKLTCTACHSGPWPQMDAQQFQTALAHGLGLASRERHEATPPSIYGPVFSRNADGKLEPHRVTYPSYWAYRLDANATAPGVNRFAPIPPEQVLKLAGDVLPKEGLKASDWQAALPQVLERLRGAGGDPVYVSTEPVFGLGSDGQLTPVNAIVRPPHWPIAHDVRPASQSLGVRGCTDCHAPEGAIFFGRSPLGIAGLPDYNRELALAWASSFPYRPLFKCFAAICALLVAWVLLGTLVDAARWGLKTADAAPTTSGAPLPHAPPKCVPCVWGMRLNTLARVVLVIAALGGAITAFGSEWTRGEFSGWALLAHMVTAGIFTAALALAAPLWVRQRAVATILRNGAPPAALDAVRAVIYWLLLACGLGLLGTMVVAMLPLVGTAGQRALIEWHEWAGIGFLVLLGVWLVVSLAGRRK